MRVIYDGPLDGVDLPVPGERAPRTVLRGDVIEVPADFGERLLEQDIWTKAPEPKKPAKAATTPEEEKA